MLCHVGVLFCRAVVQWLLDGNDISPLESSARYLAAMSTFMAPVVADQSNAAAVAVATRHLV